MIYPWQQTQWEQIGQAKKVGRLPHALLFAGLEGTGKAHFAECFARGLCCEKNADGNACQTCHSCRLMEAKSHPSVLWIHPEKEGGTIKVEQIREIAEFVNQTALKGNLRIVIIHPAEEMNINASNALLKTLEEPSTGSLILLVSNEPARLPATVLSRCQKVYFKKPKTSDAIAWLSQHSGENGSDRDWSLLLNLANGAPLAALRLASEEILSARKVLYQALYTAAIAGIQELKDVDFLMLLDFTLSWTIDILKLQSGSNHIVNTDYSKQLMSLKEQCQLSDVISFMSYLHQLRKQFCRGINLNKQLMLETILIRWKNIKSLENAQCF